MASIRIEEESVVLLNELVHALAYAVGVDGGLDSGLSYSEDAERQAGNVSIDENDACGGGLDQGLERSPGCIEVTLEEDHLGWWRGGTDEEVKLLLLLGLGVFDTCHTLVDSLLQGYELVVDGVSLEEVVA